jgi:hypothetical protein
MIRAPLGRPAAPWSSATPTRPRPAAGFPADWWSPGPGCACCCPSKTTARICPRSSAWSAVRTRLLRILIERRNLPRGRFGWTVKQHAARFIDQGISQRRQIGKSWQLGEVREGPESQVVVHPRGSVPATAVRVRQVAGLPQDELRCAMDTWQAEQNEQEPRVAFARFAPLGSHATRRAPGVQRSYDLDLIAQKIRKFQTASSRYLVRSISLLVDQVIA